MKRPTRYKLRAIKDHSRIYKAGEVMALGKVKDLEQMKKQFAPYVEGVDYKVELY